MAIDSFFVLFYFVSAMRSCRIKQLTLEQTVIFLIQVKDSEN